MRNLSIMLIAISVIAAACSSASAEQGEDAPTLTTAATPTTATTTPPTTEATAAPGAAATVTYDGTNCTYDGPDEFTAGPLDITYVNDSDQDVGLHIARLFDDTDFEEYMTDMLAGTDVDPISETVLWLNRGFEGLENRGELSENLTTVAGRHAPTCVKFTGDGPPSEWFFTPLIAVAETD